MPPTTRPGSCPHLLSCLSHLRQHRLEQLSDLAGPVGDERACSFQSGHLVFDRSFPGGDDRPRVPHLRPLRRGPSSHGSDQRLGERSVFYRLGHLFFHRPAELADDDHGFGLGVLLEQGQHLGEPGQGHGVSSYAHQRRGSETGLYYLNCDLVRQRAAARRDTDASGAVDALYPVGEEPHHRLARRDHPRGISPDYHGAGREGGPPYPQGVVHGDSFGQDDDSLDPGVQRLVYRVFGETGRYEEQRGVRRKLLGGPPHGVEYGYPLDLLSLLAGRYAGYDVRAKLDHVPGPEPPFLACNTLDQHPRRGIHDNAHLFALPASSMAFSIASSVSSNSSRSTSPRSSRTFSSPVPRMAATMGKSGSSFLSAPARSSAITSARAMVPNVTTRTTFGPVFIMSSRALSVFR